MCYKVEIWTKVSPENLAADAAWRYYQCQVTDMPG